MTAEEFLKLPEITEGERKLVEQSMRRKKLEEEQGIVSKSGRTVGEQIDKMFKDEPDLKKAAESLPEELKKPEKEIKTRISLGDAITETLKKGDFEKRMNQLKYYIQFIGEAAANETRAEARKSGKNDLRPEIVEIMVEVHRRLNEVKKLVVSAKEEYFESGDDKDLILAAGGLARIADLLRQLWPDKFNDSDFQKWLESKRIK